MFKRIGTTIAERCAPGRFGYWLLSIGIYLVIVSWLLVILPAFAADLSLDDVIKNLQANQSKIHDMYAETTTTITSTIAMPGAKDKGPQKMVQKGRMWTKGSDKSKIEMLSPMKQITITNGDKMAIINPETGQKVIQDRRLKTKDQRPFGETGKEMSLEKAKEFFDLSVRKLDASKPGSLETYVIVGVPKKENKFLGKMEFYVDSERWVPVKILMYDAKGKLMSQSSIEYQESSGVWTPVKNVSDVNTPMGTMKVEMEFKNIKVNKGVSDKEFEVN